MTSATLKHVTVDDLLEAVFSVWSAMAAATRKGVFCAVQHEDHWDVLSLQLEFWRQTYQRLLQTAVTTSRGMVD